MNREEILRNIRQRPKTQKFKLAALRIFAAILNFGIIVGGIYLIIYVQDHTDDIKKWAQELLEGNEFLLRYVNIFPSLVISLLNVALPTVNKAIVKLEQNDFPETDIKNEIQRNFIQKIVNLTTFVFISHGDVYPVDVFIDSWLGTSFQKRIDEKTALAAINGEQHTCEYDNAGVALAQLALTELGVMIFVQLFKAIGLKLFFGMILRRSEWRKSRHKYLSDFVIWMLYNKAVHWITILNVPYFIFAVPFIDYIGFQWISIVMTYFYAKGSAASSDIGQYLMRFMNITIFYVQLIISPWFILTVSEDCGPIPLGKKGWDPITEWIGDYKGPNESISGWIYTILTFWPMLILIILALSLTYFMYANKADIEKMYSDSKDDEFNQTIMDQASQMGRLKTKLQFLYENKQQQVKEKGDTD